MKLFLDTANLQFIKKWAPTGLIDGVTTNPTHLSKEGADPTKQVMEICTVMKPYGDVSVEVTEQEPETVYKQAHAISKLASNSVVKVPCSKEYYGVIKRLVADGIKINSTLVFNLEQSLLMAKLGVTYISPFIGRLDDIGVDGLHLIGEIRAMLDLYEFESKLLAASLRTIYHVHGVILSGADIATIPVAIFEKMMEHPLTEKGIEKFNEDWQKLGVKKFP